MNGTKKGLRQKKENWLIILRFFRKYNDKSVIALLFISIVSAWNGIGITYLLSYFVNVAAARSCVFITHRLASVKYTDKILVMKDGQLIEQGTHEELVARDGQYKEMFSAQIGWYQ